MQQVGYELKVQNSNQLAPQNPIIFKSLAVEEIFVVCAIDKPMELHGMHSTFAAQPNPALSNSHDQIWYTSVASTQLLSGQGYGSGVGFWVVGCRDRRATGD